MQNRRPTVLPSSMEITFGFCFLAFQVLFLGTAIVAAATALHAPIDNLTVNILYFPFANPYSAPVKKDSTSFETEVSSQSTNIFG